MKARAISNAVVLDYCHVSEPLTFDMIQKDISEVQCGGMVEPAEIVLWRHQWNWLVELCQPLTVCSASRASLEAMAGVTIGDSLAQVKIRRLKTIYGIPLRLVN